MEWESGQQVFQNKQRVKFITNIGTTGANLDSSRSHAILQITFKLNYQTNSEKIFSKLSFIDLAGNERGADVKDQNKQTR